jgi:flagellar biosynthesis GTPase FlhF
MKEALNKVRADLGPEAVILDARQCQASGLARILAMFGISQKPMFEVMAAIDRDGHAWGREFSSVLESAREAGAPTSEPGFGREPGFAGTSLQSEGNGESKGHGLPWDKQSRCTQRLNLPLTEPVCLHARKAAPG